MYHLLRPPEEGRRKNSRDSNKYSRDGVVGLMEGFRDREYGNVTPNPTVGYLDLLVFVI